MPLSLVNRAALEASSFSSRLSPSLPFRRMESRRAPQTAAPTGPDAFSPADANHDGKLSRDEASDFLVIRVFVARDANHDSRMTLEEWIGGDPTRSADFKKRDANNDGIVTMQEAIAFGRASGVVNEIMREADTRSRWRTECGRSDGLLRQPRRPGELGPYQRNCVRPPP